MAQGQMGEMVALPPSIFPGGIGVDRFSLGRIGPGILKLVAVGGFGIRWLYDILMIATGRKTDERRGALSS